MYQLRISQYSRGEQNNVGGGTKVISVNRQSVIKNKSPFTSEDLKYA